MGGGGGGLVLVEASDPPVAMVVGVGLGVLATAGDTVPPSKC